VNHAVCYGPCRPSLARLLGLTGRRPLLILAIRRTLRRGRRRLEKSGGPALFALSLKLQGDDDAHNQLRVFFRKQLPGDVGMPVGTTVFRIRTELIFRQCWNPITLRARQAAPR
jgi:hypothetical protein